MRVVPEAVQCKEMPVEATKEKQTAKPPTQITSGDRSTDLQKARLKDTTEP